MRGVKEINVDRGRDRCPAVVNEVMNLWTR